MVLRVLGLVECGVLDELSDGLITHLRDKLDELTLATLLVSHTLQYRASSRGRVPCPSRVSANEFIPPP